MAAHLSIAKAAFGASLLRPDVTRVSRDDLPTFHDAFDGVLSRGSSRDIQTCKQWLAENVIVSPGRTGAFAKYLSTTSTHLESQQNAGAQASSPSRQRLHILYLVNDLLHHGKHHTIDPVSWKHLNETFQPVLPELLRLGASSAKSRVSRRLSDLVDLWEQEEYYASTTIAQLRDALGGKSSEPKSVQDPAKADVDMKEIPYLLPSFHGDPSLPYHDLPAGNLMRYIVPNSSQPMRVDEIRALQLSSGPADESLINALQDFLKDVTGLETSPDTLEDAGLAPEIDELGQISYHDEAGDLLGDTYYGWSRAFCDKMKRRGLQESSRPSSQSRSSSRSRSRSALPSKRRRRNSSGDQRSKSSRSYSSSSSRSRSGPADRYRKSSPRRGRLNSRSRSYSPRYDRVKNVREEPPRPEVSAAFKLVPQASFGPPPAPQGPIPTASGVITIPPRPFGNNVGYAAPPSRPPHWVGPWPPPPPPPFGGNGGYSNMPFPPPPPPMNFPNPPGGWSGYPSAPPGQNNRFPRGR